MTPGNPALNLEPGRAGKRLATPKDAKERKEVVRQLDTLRVFVSLCLCVFVVKNVFVHREEAEVGRGFQ